jgi:OHCU decarboxylase
MTAGLGHFNSITQDDAVRQLMKCCGSSKWADGVAVRRPFESIEDLIGYSEALWRKLSPSDWLEAFSHHPKIGERAAARAQTDQEKEWSQQEQSSAAVAPEALLSRLGELNQAYEERFGYIFIVCATGKSTEEMLELIAARIRNDEASELKNAADEQRKITELRLRKLFTDE